MSHHASVPAHEPANFAVWSFNQFSVAIDDYAGRESVQCSLSATSHFMDASTAETQIADEWQVIPSFVQVSQFNGLNN